MGRELSVAMEGHNGQSHYLKLMPLTSAVFDNSAQDLSSERYVFFVRTL